MRACFALIGCVLAPFVWLLVAAILTPVPRELREGTSSESVRFTDRNGTTLREVRADDGMRSRWITRAEFGESFVAALVAAEDKRFFTHHGIDGLALARAAFSDLRARKIVSGASTLTMQLARLLVPHPRRSMVGKFREAALALRLEWTFSKQDLLEQYVNRAPFGEGIRGASAGALYYFDKPLSSLSWSEAAALAAIPKGPSVYSPERHRERLLARRRFVLTQLRANGSIDASTFARAESEPLTLHVERGTFGAPHLVDALMLGRVSDAVPKLKGRADLVVTTIDRELQRIVETRVAQVTEHLRGKHVGAAAAVVLDNESGEILAYVGSPAFFDEAREGANDGVLALRQPGSALKPFVYGLAMETLGFGAETVLPDVEQEFQSESGAFVPKNYDERTHGPVRLREALGNSLNIPAVYTADRIGIARVRDRLVELGMTSLGRTDLYYGAALALGDGEVRLLDLANGYATLARGGVWLPPKPVRTVGKAGGEQIAPTWAEARRVMPQDVAWLVTDILRDRSARLASFGERNVLELPFPVAAKTGTSKGFRDNWAVGYTGSRTVAVWVGNFDGSSMEGVSGITGAGPLFRDIMIAAMQGDAAATSHAGDAAPEGFRKMKVCLLSGGAPTDACPHRGDEWVRAGANALEACQMHVKARVDRRNGLPVNAPTVSCPASMLAEQSFEVFPPVYTAWAAGAHRPLLPAEESPLCATGVAGARRDGRDIVIVYPSEGATFAIDPARPATSQALSVRVDAPGAPAVVLRVDGKRVDGRPTGQELVWRLARGTHVLRAEAGTLVSPPRTVYVN